MEGGLPKKDGLSTKGKQGNGFFSPNLHALVSVSKLISLSHVLCLRQSLLHLHVLR